MAFLTIETTRASGTRMRESVDTLDSFIEFLEDDNNTDLIYIEFNGDKKSLLGKVFRYAIYILNSDGLKFTSKKNLIISFIKMLKEDNNYID